MIRLMGSIFQGGLHPQAVCGELRRNMGCAQTVSPTPWGCSMFIPTPGQGLRPTVVAQSMVWTGRALQGDGGGRPSPARLGSPLEDSSLSSPTPAHGAQSVTQCALGLLWMVPLQRTPMSPSCVQSLGFGACIVRTRVEGACLGGAVSSWGPAMAFQCPPGG